MFRTTLFVLVSLVGWVPQVQRDRVVVSDVAGSAVISGRVTTRDVNGAPQPVRRATVTIETGAPAKIQKTDTDTQGRYRFERLAAGAYRIRAEKPGFVPGTPESRRAFERPAEFNVVAGQKLARDLPMIRGAAFEGRILKDTGEPAVNVVVSAMRFTYDNGPRRAMPVRQARTDDRGRFRLHSLPAGEYYLEAATDALETARLSVPVAGTALTTMSRAFYPGAPRIEGGQSMPLTEGQNVTGLDFSMPAVPASALRMTLLDSAGAAGKSPLVRVQRVGGVTGEVRGFISPANGEVTFPIVPAGEFWVMGAVRPSPAADPEFAVTRLTVNGETLQPLVLTTARGAVINGRIEVEGTTGPALASLQVVAHETDFELPPLPEATGSPAPGTVAADGGFSFKSLFGPRILRLQKLPAGWALKSVWLDGVDVSDVPIDFRGGESPRAVRMVITARTGTLSGIARDEAGQPVRRARIVAFSADDRLWGWRSRMVKSAEADEQGRYTIGGLLQGNYHVVAVPFLDEGSWFDATILSRLVPVAPPLTIGEASKLVVNLVVKP